MAARSRNHCYRGKTISIIYSECESVALAIQHAKRMCRITLISVACPALQYFSTLSHNRHHIRKKRYGTQNAFWFSLQHFSKTFLIPRIIWRHITNIHWSSCKVPVIRVRFQWNPNSRQIFKKYSNTKFHENLSSRSRVVSLGGTDRHNEADSPFSQFYDCALNKQNQEH